MSARVRIIGAGLAGSEAAWQLLQAGIPVELWEMRPETMTKAHKTGDFAELVCSNSFRGTALTNAVGLLKEELRLMGSLIIEAAEKNSVPAGGALAVDRQSFAAFVEDRLRSHPLLELHRKECRSVLEATVTLPAIIASGPLTTPTLAAEIEKLNGNGNLAFFDAISPIVLSSSIDRTKVFLQSRYGKGGGADYLNVPLSESEYERFVAEISEGEKFGGREEVEADEICRLRPFEGCMPIEEMVARGSQTLRFGPLKPTGLVDPQTGRRPYAVVQLRQDDQQGKLWSMVGMQTRLKHLEQQRIFRLLPGLEQAEFVRLGSVHRNTFINSPQCLNATAEFRNISGLFFAGQLTGVEGYVESTASGLVAGINAARLMQEKALLTFPPQTAIGALQNYISDPARKFFQPMNINFGLIQGYEEEAPEKGKSYRRSGKEERRLHCAETSLALLRQLRAAELFR